MPASAAARLLPAALAALLIPSGRAAEPASAEFFETRVRPVLAEHCSKCHSAAGKQKAGLTLDSRDAMLRGGDSGPALSPDDPGKSRLVQVVGYGGDIKMPPKGKLADEQIADLTAWVKAGAVWPTMPGPAVGEGPAAKAFDLAERRKHWSFQPVQAGPPPPVRNAAWAQSPIDRFILAKLEAKGLSPSQPADKRTLLRRVTYDLTGLPPTPDEINAFLKDESPDAYEKVVDRLLASPGYGERTARHWMDLVRYAETCGHEFDADLPHAHEYRDYLIRAFNADLPYDRFVTEHVAGDLLTEPRRHPTLHFNESVIATGFWFFGEAKHSPVDVRGDEADRIDNQLDVFGKTFLGLTVACARCHDHKFDAISQKDYYALAGFLQSSRYQRAFVDDPGPTRAVERELRAIDAEAMALLRPAGARNDKSTPGQGRGEEAFASFDGPTYGDWFVTGEAFGDGPTTAHEPVWQADANRPVARLRPPGVADSGRVSGRLQGALRSPTFRIGLDRVWFRAAGKGGRVNLILDGFQHIRDPIYGGLTFAVESGDKFAWKGMDLRMWKGHAAYVEFLDDGPGSIAVDEVRFADGPSPPESPDERVAALDADLAPEDLAKLKALQARRAALEAKLPAPRRALALADGTGEDERLFIRGSHKNLGAAVPRRFLEALAGPAQPAPGHGSGRLELARRMLDGSNPLTARVMVNRLWHWHFGAGLVPTPDDFGKLGQPPTHPELLDWLADDFIANGWTLKRLHRMIVLSNTYRQSSALRAPSSAFESDPQNKLLHRMPVRRLEAEAIRDAMLAVSGRLDRAMYGPGVPPHLTPFMDGRGRPGTSGPLDGNGRRSVYLGVRRNFLPPMLLAFDYPTPFTTIGRRNVSNVPAQALALMNNPFVTQQANLWAKRVLAEKGRARDERARGMYESAFGRPPTADELAEALAFVNEQARAHGCGPDDERPWADLCHVLFNVKEFIFLG